MVFLTAAALLLAGERVRFDANAMPQFTANQIRSTAAATREGLAKWAATAEGRRMIAYFAANDCEIDVVEDPTERGVGRAPEPGLATMLSKKRAFVMILNPVYYNVPVGMAPFVGEPANSTDAMAIAWAGEMLHIYFYAHGISLPHHERPDFQRDWSEIAGELGMPAVRHDDGDEFARRVIVRYLGRGR
ncbi:MAG TPA: hypothetical protein VL284_04935 [Thermoanaerobaculia bacterium]|nr:hypothetical protein [Thermoanaerobaculia bacterium]